MIEVDVFFEEVGFIGGGTSGNYVDGIEVVLGLFVDVLADVVFEGAVGCKVVVFEAFYLSGYGLSLGMLLEGLVDFLDEIFMKNSVGVGGNKYVCSNLF